LINGRPNDVTKSVICLASRADPRLIMLPANAHQSSEAGWGVTNAGTDAESGTRQITFSDSILFERFGKEQHVEMVIAWLAKALGAS